MKPTDLLIIGGGPAGYNAALRAGAAGLRTVLFEQRALGGVCLNEGCVPSKTLLYSAKLLDGINHGEVYGVTATDAALDQAKVIARKDKTVRQLVTGIGAKLKLCGVRVVTDKAYITGKSAEGFTVQANETSYSASNLLIATGSAAVLPPIPGLREGYKSGYVLTNKEILSLKELPSSLAIIGGGVIGLEMASYYRSAGCNVTVIELMPQIGGALDPEIAEILRRNYAKKGIDFRLNCKVSEVEQGAVVYQTESGSYNRVAADKVLCAIGRKPNSTDFGLENLHIHCENGAVVTDASMCTNVPGVYAAGDVNGKSMLAHTAYREGEVAVNNILGKKDTMRYHAIPGVLYTNPEVAWVGETEQSAKEKGLPFTCKTVSMRYSGRYLAENEGGDGICKVLLDSRYHHVIGVHMIANSASELIYGAALMMETEVTAESLQELVFPHPTVGEVLRETFF